MSPSPDERLFDPRVWEPALEKYAGVTGLTVQLFDADGDVVIGPVGPNPLFQVLREHPPDLFRDCARRCLSQIEDRSPIVGKLAPGLGVVGVSLELEGKIVGAAVGGYVLVDFTQPSAMEQLARAAHVPFARLWDVARQERPVPERRLILNGELLQVLGDALLKENHRTRQYEEVASRLQVVATAKDEFFAVLSHELRAPLTPILGWTQILKGASNPAQLRRGLDVIERNAHLQTRLVEDLLDLNRLTRGKVPLDLRLHDLGDVLQSAVETIIEGAEDKEIRLQIGAADEPLIVKGDAGRLQQIFRNILSNALKFTLLHGQIDIGLARQGDSAVVTIADTGEGVAPEFLPFVFDMFRQQEEGTRRQHGGLGVGLALVKRLTELHGGDVSMVSRGKGRGTAVIVRLPLASEKDAATFIKPKAEISSSAPLRNLKILLVEDADDTREATRLLLEGLGAHVLVAGDGREGLELAANADPDVVLCDLRMPNMDGFEFIRELHRASNQPELPVVALSGLANEADHERTRIAGFEAHVDKPFDHTKLVTAVDSALHRRIH